jgi:hypothetical protein
MFRIRQATLSSLGFGSTNVDQFQIWKNGVQVALYTTIQNAPLGPSDYIEFWGTMNDGKPDLPLYREPGYQLADKWSLETDTSAYFLTINPAGPNARMTQAINNVAGNTLSVEPYFIIDDARNFNVKIHPGRAEIVGDSYTYSASYDSAEGWTTGDISTGATIPTYLFNSLVYTGAGAPAGSFIRINAYCQNRISVSARFQF